MAALAGFLAQLMPPSDWSPALQTAPAEWRWVAGWLARTLAALLYCPRWPEPVWLARLAAATLSNSDRRVAATAGCPSVPVWRQPDRPCCVPRRQSASRPRFV